MTEILVRPAEPSDAAIIAEFNSRMAAETEGLRLDPARLRAGVDAVLADETKGRYWIARRGANALGQLLVTYEWSDWRNGVFWWIQSVYVDPEARGQGVYKTMYRELEKRARQANGVCGIRLYVEHENKRAQAVYERLGMARAPYEVFEVDFVIRR